MWGWGKIQVLGEGKEENPSVDRHFSLQMEHMVDLGNRLVEYHVEKLQTVPGGGGGKGVPLLILVTCVMLSAKSCVWKINCRRIFMQKFEFLLCIS